MTSSLDILAKLAEARAKATAGPWKAHEIYDEGDVVSRGVSQAGGKGLNHGEDCELFSTEDAAFIALCGCTDFKALLAEHRRLMEALNEIVDPIAYMRARLKQGERLDGVYAMHLSHSASHLQSIAAEAIHEAAEAAAKASPRSHGGGSWSLFEPGPIVRDHM